MYTHIIAAAQTRCILESINRPAELGRGHTQASGSSTSIDYGVAHLHYTQMS
jgi:hypothetical protein